MLTVKAFEFNPVQENTYVLFNEKDACCIIDPGCYFGNERTALQEFIEQQGLIPQLLLNTHCHLDHVFGNKFVYETWGLPLHLHEKEQPVLARAPEAGLLWGMPFENYRAGLVYLTPGKQVAVGEDELTILFLPGHSPGSVGFYSKDQGFIIGGDVLFRGSIGRTDLPGETTKPCCGASANSRGRCPTKPSFTPATASRPLSDGRRNTTLF
ncbi:MBL fold metallo-hydrolase [Puia sp. P3]|uniref:MBL fold metallo-hydrolase n=1 Tax=Puia sp. P3 TaxID=3423952 RepID=UPI003D6768E9